MPKLTLYATDDAVADLEALKAADVNLSEVFRRAVREELARRRAREEMSMDGIDIEKAAARLSATVDQEADEITVAGQKCGAWWAASTATRGELSIIAAKALDDWAGQPLAPASWWDILAHGTLTIRAFDEWEDAIADPVVVALLRVDGNALRDFCREFCMGAAGVLNRVTDHQQKAAQRAVESATRKAPDRG